MLKKYSILVLVLLMVLPLGVLARCCPGVRGGETGSIPGSPGDDSPLSADEISWLRYMREEEKLARDVYLHQNRFRGMWIFTPIACSEERHTNAVKNLLYRYGIPDPAAGTSPGDFSNPVFRNMYNRMTEQGQISPVEALRAGILVEETDIADLKTAISKANHGDIRTVYIILLAGSYNHLSAFENSLARY